MNSEPIPTLDTKRLNLIPLARVDATMVRDYFERNKEHLQPWEPEKHSQFYSLNYWHQRIKDALDDFLNDRAYCYVIQSLNKSPQVIGWINFSQVFHGAFYACYLGFSLDSHQQGQGFMTEALEKTIDYVFSEKHIHRIMANYMPHNKASGRVLEKLHFVIEGRAKQYLRINGLWQDHVLTSLTNPLWKET